MKKALVVGIAVLGLAGSASAASEVSYDTSCVLSTSSQLTKEVIVSLPVGFVVGGENHLRSLINSGVSQATTRCPDLTHAAPAKVIQEFAEVTQESRRGKTVQVATFVRRYVRNETGEYDLRQDSSWMDKKYVVDTRETSTSTPPESSSSEGSFGDVLIVLALAVFGLVAIWKLVLKPVFGILGWIFKVLGPVGTGAVVGAAVGTMIPRLANGMTPEDYAVLLAAPDPPKSSSGMTYVNGGIGYTGHIVGSVERSGGSIIYRSGGKIIAKKRYSSDGTRFELVEGFDGRIIAKS